ncbi:hypothetical protein [Metabacillus arenae]|uniref:Uncharacterized protein n=1 Tax=Metabacillus arenae TaxID=2771434 RepID=A0A926N854_9BACI|nr:hypothetical protein [Metabacillus arenae]MBD1379177.1 hypothetical protein [Metabacillus arenae]
MMNVNQLTTEELLMEKSHMEQLGYPGEVMLLEITEEIQKRYAQMKAEQTKQEESKPAQSIQEEQTVINVFYEEGYKWTVNINGEESIDCSLTKKDAMVLARTLKKQYNNAVINEQKLSKKERKRNLSWLHENSFAYDRSM